MTQSEKIERIKYLVAALSEASKAYYAQDREIMSNREYDALYDELAVLERETGMVLANSPTMSVGYEAVDELPKERHESPMLSLDKTKSREELAEWLQGHPAVLSWKLDGLTIVLTYREGKLEKAVTRGNGEIGEVITNNARTFVNLPLEIPFRGELVLRGEAVISYSDFQKINDEIENADARYKNPRNLCSGSVRQLNNEITARRNVRFYAFALVDAREADSGDADVGADSVEAQFRFLEEQGFETVEHYLVTEENILDTVERFEKKIETYDIPSDGLVLVYDDIAYGRSLGRTAKFPRNSIAFKWADELRETRLLEIEWSASRTGLINPVAIFEPVELEGTTVSRASVHNISILRGLHLGLGDRITVYKANMIIPQIAENLTARDLLAQAQAEDVRAGEENRLAEEERSAGGEHPMGKEASAGEEPPTGKKASAGEEQPVGKGAWEGEEPPTGKEAPTGQELPADDAQVIEEGDTEEDAGEKAETMGPALAMRGHRPVEIPSVCPVCGGATEIRQVNDVQSLYCTNVRCAAKQIKAFTLFVSRDAMNIDGLSEATLEKFIDMGFIQEFADLFHLGRYRERIVEILYLTDQPDQLLMEVLREYKEKSFRSAVDGDLELEDMPEEKPAEEYKEALDFVKEALGQEVDEVRVSRKLKTHPVCLTCGEGVSFEMERYFAVAQPEMGMKAKRILELNVDHPAFATLDSARAGDPEKARKYAQVLFNQAKLIAGLPITDPSGYTDLLCSLWA